MNVLSYGLVLVNTLDLGLLGVMEYLCADCHLYRHLPGYQNIYVTQGHKKIEVSKRTGQQGIINIKDQIL